MGNSTLTVAVLFTLSFGFSAIAANGSGGSTGRTTSSPGTGTTTSSSGTTTPPTSGGTTTTPPTSGGTTTIATTLAQCVNTAATKIQAAVGNGVGATYGQKGVDGSIAAASAFCASTKSVNANYGLTIPAALVSCINNNAVQIENIVGSVAGVTYFYPNVKGVDGSIEAANSFCTTTANINSGYTQVIPFLQAACINTSALFLAQALNLTGGLGTKDSQAAVDGALAVAGDYCALSANNITLPQALQSCVLATVSPILAAFDDAGTGTASLNGQLGINGALADASKFCQLPINVGSNYSYSISDTETTCLNTAAAPIEDAVAGSNGIARKYSELGLDGSLISSSYGACLNDGSATLQQAVGSGNGTLALTGAAPIAITSSFGAPATSYLLNGPATFSISGGQYGMIQILQITAAEQAVSAADYNVTWIPLPNLLPDTVPSPFSVNVTEPAGPMTISGTIDTIILSTFDGTETLGCYSPTCTDTNGSPITGCSATQQVTGTFNKMQTTINASFADQSATTLANFAGTPQQYNQLVTQTSATACVVNSNPTGGFCSTDADCPAPAQCNQSFQCVIY